MQRLYVLWSHWALFKKYLISLVIMNNRYELGMVPETTNQNDKFSNYLIEHNNFLS